MPAITELLPYILALGLAAAIPGPGMTAIVARTLNGALWRVLLRLQA